MTIFRIKSLDRTTRMLRETEHHYHALMHPSQLPESMKRFMSDAIGFEFFDLSGNKIDLQKDGDNLMKQREVSLICTGKYQTLMDEQVVIFASPTCRTGWIINVVNKTLENLINGDSKMMKIYNLNDTRFFFDGKRIDPYNDNLSSLGVTSGSVILYEKVSFIPVKVTDQQTVKSVKQVIKILRLKRFKVLNVRRIKRTLGRKHTMKL